ncbi:MAG TPA: SH3 domain-containing protein [Polyangiaceae bacterium]|nr:SH3 domain-containing protein [Polyangiaceae bacterium]
MVEPAFEARARGHLPAERRQPLKIEIPNQKQETLRFGRVGLIVSAGFLIGIIWPRVAGFKLVPSVPSQPAESSSADLTGAPGEAKAAAPAPPPVPEQAAPVGSAASGAPFDRLRVSEPQFLACKNRGKKVKEECDQIEFDRLARPHIQALAACAGADKLSGALSLGFDLDFTSQTVKNVKSGKSTTFSEAETQALIDCEKKEFSNVSLVGIAHKHEAYSLFYKVEFPKAEAEKGEAPPPAGEALTDVGDVTEASGHATVAWDVALVRSSASRDGAVVARVLQGTRVSVTGRRGDWYRIKYDVKGSVGWVYRTAIGM